MSETTETTAAPPLSPLDEAAWARDFVRTICDAAPRRMATSEDERRAHGMIQAEMERIGLSTEVHEFTWHRSLYANLALHFGLGTIGSIVAPWAPALGLALHATSALSYALDSSRQAFLLRRLFPFQGSQNVLGYVRAKSGPRRRVVFLAHADAAFTGLLFQPEFVKRLGAKPGSPLFKSLRIATGALAGLAVLDAVQLATGKSKALTAARAVLSLPPFLAAALNVDVVVRNQIVPGAADDLSGVAGLVLLARRLQGKIPDDVEVVFVATGCEESGLGGAQSLARDMRGRWDTDNTVIIGMDSLANGDLCYYEEGEVFPVPLAPWLRETIESVTSSTPHLADVAPFEIPVGGTDAIPFAVAGYPAVTLGCVDRKMGLPRHYHVPTDTPDNMEAEQIPRGLDLAERLFHAVCAR